MDDNKQIQHTKQAINPVLIALEEADAYAEKIKDSDYGTAFERAEKDETGKVIRVIKKEDIIANILIGKELGLTPIASVLLGKKLNRNTLLSVQRGKALGLNLIDAIENIYTIDTQNGAQTYTGVHIITSILLKHNIKFDIIKNYTTHWRYKTVNPSVELDDDECCNPDGELKDIYFVYIKGVTKDEEFTSAIQSGKIAVTRSNVGKITIIRFERKIDDYVKIHYEKYTSEMGRAEKFLPTYDNNGNELTTGKPNWVTKPSSMFRSRCISRGARFIASDVLYGTLTVDEVNDDIKAANEPEITIDVNHEVVK